MAAPNTPTDIIDRLRALERQVNDLAGRVNIRPALNTIVGGSVTIKEGGQLLVQDSDGTNVFNIGRVLPDVDGQPQQATVIRRMDGSLAFAVWTSATTGAQKVVIYDKNSNGIFADDVNSPGGGLAVPWIPIPMPVNSVAAAAQTGYFNTTSSTFVRVARSIGFFQHPKVFIDVQMSFGASTTGQARIKIGGDVIVTYSASGSGVYDIPNWQYPGYPVQMDVELEMIRNTGTGTVYATTRAIYGRQS